jgi:uncharacterized protein (TIGR00661 family)
MGKSKTILVAPLNWGLGHATRCIPIINALLKDDFNVIIASDGAALQLLRKEFPSLESLELPSYNIKYPKNGSKLIWNVLANVPSLKRIVTQEKLEVQKLLAQGKIDGIISDNRFGVRNKKIPSVYITHQVNIMAGRASFISKKLHYNIIRKFDVCWGPDSEGITNLSGRLGHLKTSDLNLKYTGILSRMKKEKLPIKYPVLVLISGPETQRTLFEELMLKEFKNTHYKVILVRGVVEESQNIVEQENMTIYNYMTTFELEKTINESELIVARSGYTTLMDLSVLEKKAFFIPTPGQYEQIYLAQRMSELKMAPYCNQKDFTIDKLKEVVNYSGLKNKENTMYLSELLDLFKRK